MQLFATLISFFLVIASYQVQAWPQSFEQAKVELRRSVYFDRNQDALGELYCGCDWEWVGRSGGRVDHETCGYVVRRQEHRAARIEYEHIVPAHSFGHQRQCWQEGGRANCAANDPVFQHFYTNPFNLTVVIGEVNADRSNYRFTPLPGLATQYGACDFKVDFANRAAEPPDRVKGKIARAYFYVHHTYNLSMSAQQERIFLAWNRQFPVTQEERLLHDRKAKLFGSTNPFVTGELTWETRGSAQSQFGANASLPPKTTHPQQPDQQQQSPQVTIRGNKNSKIYHLPHCPHFDRIGQNNRVEFRSEQEAISAGYRKAGNCH